MESQHIGIDMTRGGGGFTFSDPHEDIHSQVSLTALYILTPHFGLLAWLNFYIHTYIPDCMPSSAYTVSSVSSAAHCRQAGSRSVLWDAGPIWSPNKNISNLSTCCLVNKVIRPSYIYIPTIILQLQYYSSLQAPWPRPPSSNRSGRISSSSIFFFSQALRMGQLQWKLQYSSHPSSSRLLLLLLLGRLYSLTTGPRGAPHRQLWLLLLLLHHHPNTP